MFVAAAIVASTTLVNHEVGKRLATLPLTTTTLPQPPTTIATAAPDTPRPVRQKRNQPAPVVTVDTSTTTTTTMVVAQEVPKSAYDIITKLNALDVEDEHAFGYTRAGYGSWRDEDKDGCTTPYDVVIDQGIDVVVKKNPCGIASGEWHSLYDDVLVQSPDDIAVDHVVSLYESWKSGAWKWTDAQRNDYLNDMKNVNAILAVSRVSQKNKAARDPKDWLPAYQAYRCRYLQTWVDVKTQWKLSVDPGEREAIAGAALNC